MVNVASGAGKVGIPFAAMYCATKHAVVGYARSMAEASPTEVPLWVAAV